MSRCLLPFAFSFVLLGSPRQSIADERASAPVFHRLQKLSDEDLRKQLQVIPELGFDQSAAAVVYAPILKAKKNSPDTAPAHDYGLNMYNRLAASLKRPDIVLLPWRLGLDSQMGKESAERLDVLSDNLRRYLRESVPRGDTRPDADKLRQLVQAGKGSRGAKTSNGTRRPRSRRCFRCSRVKTRRSEC